MATAAPHVKLLRQLASAKDDYLSGAFDVSWDGAKATLYLVFGRPSHAVLETDHAQIEGEAAIDALLAELPRVFVVSDWRRAMSPRETLSITIDELAGPFVRLAGSYADDPVADESPEWWSAVDDSPDLPFGLADFPLLPGGRPLWVEASPDEVHLAERLSELPPSILILTGAKLRAAAVVSGGDLIDAVWIDADDHARGETAGMALLGATKGSLAGYALDDPRVAEALTMIWRLPLAVSGIDLTWLDPASMLAAFHADGLDRVLMVDAPVRGIALFSRGRLVAVYSETQRSAVASPERLRSLLSQARGRLTVMERKPRPLAVEAMSKPASAYDFFEVAPSGPVADATATVEAEPALEAVAAAEVTTIDASLAGSPPAAEVAGGAGDEPVGPSFVGDASAAPPPPPPGEAVPAGASEAPPAPPPVAEAVEHTRRARRSRWGFGRFRRSRPDTQPAEEASVALSEAAAAAATAGWSVRQQNPDPEPAWHRSRVEDPAPVADDATTSTPPLESALAPESTQESSPGDDEVATPASHEETHALDPVSLDQPIPEPASSPASDAWLSASWLDDVVDEEAAVPATEAVATSEPEVAVDADGRATEADATSEPDVATDAEEPAAEADATSAPDVATDAEEPAAEADATSAHDFAADAEEPAAEADATSEPDVAADADDHPEADEEPIAAAADPDPTGDVPQAAPIFRTPGPWNWPLAEPEPDTPAAETANWFSRHSSSEHEAMNIEPAAVAASGDEDTAPALEHGAESEFFHRHEPVGSKYVDFDEVRNELVQIGVVWLGETNAVQVTALLSSTRSTIDDFVATIDTIRGLHLEGQDPASIQAMAREMHQQAAERLSGA
jgi:hypothetical protein